MPIVTFSSRNDQYIPGTVWVSDEDTTGFTINHSAGSTISFALEFNWIAIGVEEALVSISDGTTEEIEVTVASDVTTEAATVTQGDSSAPVAPQNDSGSEEPVGDSVTASDSEAVSAEIASEPEAPRNDEIAEVATDALAAGVTPPAEVPQEILGLDLVQTETVSP